MEPRLTRYKQEQVAMILAVGGTRAMAAQFVGCHPRTIYNTAKADANFAEKLRHAEVSPEFHMLSALSDAYRKGIAHAAKWGLERIYQNRYRPRSPHTFTHEEVRQVLEEFTKQLADDAPGEQERTRILQTGVAFAKELRQLFEPPSDSRLQVLAPPDVDTFSKPRPDPNLPPDDAASSPQAGSPTESTDPVAPFENCDPPEENRHVS